MQTTLSNSELDCAIRDYMKKLSSNIVVNSCRIIGGRGENGATADLDITIEQLTGVLTDSMPAFPEGVRNITQETKMDSSQTDEDSDTLETVTEALKI